VAKLREHLLIERPGWFSLRSRSAAHQESHAIVYLLPLFECHSHATTTLAIYARQRDDRPRVRLTSS
jgi:hypothetical protein